MNLNYLIYIILLAFILGCEKKPAVVATVGKLTITEEEFRDEIKKYIPPQSDISSLSKERKTEYLEGLILTKLKLNAAYDAGLDKDSSLAASHRNYTDKLVHSKYFEKKIMDRLVTTEDIDESFENRQYEVRTTHILISFRDVNRRLTRSREQAANLADSLSRAARSGADLGDMAQKFSDDPRAVRDNGQLPFFTWGQMVDPFQRAVWDMEVGEISDPVETRYGFHIIRLDERREVPSYKPDRSDEAVYKIKQDLLAMKGQAGREMSQKHEAELKAEKNFLVDENKASFLASVITVKVNNGELSAAGFSETEKDIKLATWNGGFMTFNDMLEDATLGTKRMLVRFSDMNILIREVKALALRKLYLYDAREAGIYEDPWVLYHAGRMLEQQLARVIETRQVNDVIKIDSAEARNYYEQHPEKFMRAAEMEIWEIQFKDKPSAEKKMKSLTRGNFKSMAAKFSADKKYGPAGGYIGFMQKAARGPVTKKAFELGPGGKIGGPVRYRGAWTVVMTGSKREASLRPFEEIKGRATSLLKRKRLREEKARWEEGLREKYTVEINTNFLNGN